MARLCHNCRFDGKGDPACIACKGGDGISNKGHTFISIDAARDANAAQLIMGRVACDYRPNEHTHSRVNVPKEVLPYLEDAIRPFTQLTDKDGLLVLAMMRGETLSDYSERTGAPFQTVYNRWRSLLKRNPIWYAIANGAIGIGRGRRSAKGNQ